ncbi:MAG: alpha-L-fucosidase [Oscillospiraceae bacterium]|nr:alpha-L-fucosidase [Oscillospiraceae bacterium]MCL2278532.1 alpha-L-fucosidase [Oscillospiraceae bacterium]
MQQKNLLERLVSIRPTSGQINWQALEFYAFIHYGVNTYTDMEWGSGKESPAIFNPTALDTDKWCEHLKSANMTAVIITAKHHDGFCLFDSKYTNHTVMHSPYGKDIVAELAESCRNYGLKLGVYLSPWDQHDHRYGTGDEYNDFFCNQLTELMTNYGELFCLWFDGACGEGPNGKIQAYDWERYFALIRKIMPNAVIASMGPDVRWCGNEAGVCRESEFSVVPMAMSDIKLIQDMSQKEDSPDFASIVHDRCVEDIGSREALKDVAELCWYPAEVDYSIRPGWFYHASEDDKVHSLERLKTVYLKSVGGNAALLLNIPPNRAGLIHANDAKRIAELGDWIRASFSVNLLENAVFTASDTEVGYCAENINKGTWKSLEDSQKPWVEAVTETPVSPKYLVLQEDISHSQRIERFTLSCLENGNWTQVCTDTIVGYKRICMIEKTFTSDKWKIEITSCRLGATLKSFMLF